LGVPFISLDTLYWNPGWKVTPPAEFRQKVQDALARAPHGWVADGNYTKSLGDSLSNLVTDKIWLDTPFALYFPRLVWRTTLRLLRLRPQCSDGCPESFRKVFFSRDSIVWWCVTQHRPVRERFSRELAADDVRAGGEGKIQRLGGWGSERDAWVRAVRDMVNRKED